MFIHAKEGDSAPGTDVRTRAFTQLAADNQYAHLGLALLGALAQVHAAVAPLVPAPSEEEGGGGLSSTRGAVAGLGGDVQEGADLGVAVSRSERSTQCQATIKIQTYGTSTSVLKG